MAAKGSEPIARDADDMAGFVQTVEALRVEIVRAKDDRACVASQHVSLDIAHSRLFAFCDRIEGEAMARFGAERFTAPDYRDPSTIDTQAIVAAVLSDLIREEVTTRIADLYRPGPGLTDEDRAARIGEIDRRVLDLECREEAMIRTAERAGFHLPRRANASPRVVLAFDQDLAAAPS